MRWMQKIINAGFAAAALAAASMPVLSGAAWPDAGLDILVAPDAQRSASFRR